MIPELSLLMPTRNRASDLRRGIKNALSQVGVMLELVLSDNASTDGTDVICREWAAIEPRIRFFRQEKALELYEHHNFCLEQSRGKYLGFFHDHDLHDSEFSLRCIELLKANPRVGLVGTDWRMKDNYGNCLGQRRFRVTQVEEGRQYIARTIRSGRSSVAIPGAIMPRVAVGAHRLGGAKGFGDFPLWFQIAEEWNIGHLKEILWTMCQSADAQSSTSILQMTEDYETNIGQYLSDLEQRRPEWGPWIRKRRNDSRKFVYWSLVYEWLLQLRPEKPGRPGRTLFEMYGYRLSLEQKNALRKRLQTYTPPCMGGFTRRIFALKPESPLTCLFTRLIQYPDVFRRILNLK